jgi:hypothetical protein
MGKTRLFAIAACAAAFVGVGASAAFAGEITGNGKPAQGAANANSPCAFSGLEDSAGPGTAQTFGQLVKAGYDATLGGANSNSALGFPWGCNARDFGQK